MAKTARFTNHNGQWCISVPIEMEIPFDRRVPVKRWNAKQTSYITLGEKILATKNFPSGTYHIYEIKTPEDLQRRTPGA